MNVLKFETKEGESPVLVEMQAVSGPQLAGADQNITTATQKFEEAVNAIKPIAETLCNVLSSLSPESMALEFGIKFGGTVGVLLAKSTAECNVKVTLSWKKL